MTKDEIFDDVFARVSALWPDPLVLKQVSVRNGHGFIIDGLGDIAESIRRGLSHIYDVQVNHCIFSMVKDAGEFVKIVSTNDIQRDVLKNRFEEKIRFVAEVDPMRWDEGNIKAAADYLRAD